MTGRHTKTTTKTVDKDGNAAYVTDSTIQISDSQGNLLATYTRSTDSFAVEPNVTVATVLRDCYKDSLKELPLPTPITVK